MDRADDGDFWNDTWEAVFLEDSRAGVRPFQAALTEPKLVLGSGRTGGGCLLKTDPLLTLQVAQGVRCNSLFRIVLK